MNDEPIIVPDSLQWLSRVETGREWLLTLPQLVGECLDQWELRADPPYVDAFVSFVCPVSRSDGTLAVLKVQFPDRESDGEAHALQIWDGNGAVELLAYDTSHKALLLEHCFPGTHLSKTEAAHALEVLIALLPRLWVPATEGFNSLANEADHWTETLPADWERAERPFPRSLIDAAVGVLRDLSISQGEQVLLHQDLHADNVLRAQREPWLVIDPKPLVGERELAPAPMVRDFQLGHAPDAVYYRLDRLSAELSLDRERVQGWAFAQTLAWAFDNNETLPRHVETATWLRDRATWR